MPHIEWTDDLSTNIPVIDSQHRRIVDYINQLYDAQASQDERLVDEVISDLVDYTVSHFAFEESLMEQAKYPFLAPHKQVHELFIRRVTGFVERRKANEDVTEELIQVLRKWLINHIKSEDQDYVELVASNLEDSHPDKEKGKGKGALATLLDKYFGHSR